MDGWMDGWMDLLWFRALTIPMYLGLTDGPFLPHNLILAQESPVPLPKFQMAPRLKILISSGSKKGTPIYCPFLSESPGKLISSRFPNGAHMERDTRLQGIFTSLLIYLFNISFGVPSKGALPPGLPHAVPSERDAPFLESSFIHHSKSKRLLEYCFFVLTYCTTCKEYLNIREGGWEKTYRSCQKHESLLCVVVSPSYNKPHVKFIHISNHT